MNKCLRIHAAQTGGFALFDENENGINPPPFAVVPDTEKMNEAVTLFFAEAIQVGDALGKQAEAAPYDSASYDVFEKAGEVKSNAQRELSNYVMEARLPNGKFAVFGFMDRDYAHAAADMVRALGGHVFFSKHRDGSFGNFDELSRPGDATEPDFAEVDEAERIDEATPVAAQDTQVSEVYVVTFGPRKNPAAGMVVRYSREDAQVIAMAVQMAGGTAQIRPAEYS